MRTRLSIRRRSSGFAVSSDRYETCRARAGSTRCSLLQQQSAQQSRARGLLTPGAPPSGYPHTETNFKAEILSSIMPKQKESSRHHFGDAGLASPQSFESCLKRDVHFGIWHCPLAQGNFQRHAHLGAGMTHVCNGVSNEKLILDLALSIPSDVSGEMFNLFLA